MQQRVERFLTALERAGLPKIPHGFSVIPVAQIIPAEILKEIAAFIRCFDRVTTRAVWQRTFTTDALENAPVIHPEVCFFSAWDLHLPDDRPGNWQMIEFNDNGSGFLFAALINYLYVETFGMDGRCSLVPPPAYPNFASGLADLIATESERFFGTCPEEGYLILDDLHSLQRGHFYPELLLLKKLMEDRGWRTQIGSPQELSWHRERLRCRGKPVRFIVNRSTDFLWDANLFAPAHAAFASGLVYVAPSPFTYATRSDKQLLEWLSRSGRDEELGILPEERALLSAHIPLTRRLTEDNLDELVHLKESLVFKPTQGCGGRGVMFSREVGRSRLLRLIRRRQDYVAQLLAPKRSIHSSGGTLWTDLRVWAYRGRIFLISGRASPEPLRLSLSPPGGWLPTFCEMKDP